MITVSPYAVVPFVISVFVLSPLFLRIVQNMSRVQFCVGTFVVCCVLILTYENIYAARYAVLRSSCWDKSEARSGDIYVCFATMRGCGGPFMVFGAGSS